MVVSATGFVRKMRGAAQAHLLECDDGHFYVVKFQNNPQHRRILVNEWLASSVLACLSISTPEIAVVNVSTAFLSRSPEVYIQLPKSHLAVEPGLHFGSRFPGNPSEARIYDFVPDGLFDKVLNRDELLGALVADKWTGNADARQVIFSRPSVKLASPSTDTRSSAFFATMIDQGHAFGGPTWRFFDSPLQGLYHRACAYQNVCELGDFQPWLDRLLRFPKAELMDARSKIPPEWLIGDEAAVCDLLDRLIKRRARVPDLIEVSLREALNLFPALKARGEATS